MSVVAIRWRFAFLLVPLLLGGCIDSSPRIQWGLGLPEEDQLLEEQMTPTPEELALLDEILALFGQATECPIDGWNAWADLRLPWASAIGIQEACMHHGLDETLAAYLVGNNHTDFLSSLISESRNKYAKLLPMLQEFGGTEHPMLHELLSRAAGRVIRAQAQLGEAEGYLDLYVKLGETASLESAYWQVLRAEYTIRNGIAFFTAVEAVLPPCHTDFSLAEARVREFLAIYNNVTSEVAPRDGLHSPPQWQSRIANGMESVLQRDAGIVLDHWQIELQRLIYAVRAYETERLPTVGEGYHILNRVIEAAERPGIREYLDLFAFLEPEGWPRYPDMAMRVLELSWVDWSPSVRPCAGVPPAGSAG